MKKVLVLLVIVMNYAFAKADTASITLFQQYVSHQVAKGETVYSIAKKYGITEGEITKLNPDAKKSVYEGLVLILPASASQNTTSTEDQSVDTGDLKFKTHKVRRKETLYSISKKYGISQDVIKKYNKRLYSQVLRKGDKIKIPVNYQEVLSAQETSQDKVDPQSGMITHTVIAKETKYGIARKYGISLAELEKLNPGIKDGLKEGVTVNVPQRSFAENTIIDGDKYAFYEVQKGNTVYTLLRQFKMEADELAELNPSLENGLKEGMILKVPKGVRGSLDQNVLNNTSTSVGNPDVTISVGEKASLLDSLSDFSVKKIAILLPFGVNRMGADSSGTNESLIRDDRILRISLDLYSGMLMAAEDAKKRGISSEISTYDTGYDRKDGAATNARKVERLIQNNNFKDTNAVLGPLLGANINRVSKMLSSQDTPVISPMSSNVNEGDNIFVSRPDDNLLRGKMLAYAKENGGDKNIVIIADAKNKPALSKIKAIFPNAKVIPVRKGKNGLYLYPDDIPSQMSPDKENWVFLETNDIPLISNATTSLNAQVGSKKVILFTTNKGNAYDSDEIQHMHLRNLSFHFPSVDREYKYSSSKTFIDTYEDTYGVSPSSYAIRGYDLMYDTLLRLSYAKDLYTAAATGIETDYIENKFRYGNRNNGGFSNDAVYLMMYTEDLTLKEVPFKME